MNIIYILQCLHYSILRKENKCLAIHQRSLKATEPVKKLVKKNFFVEINHITHFQKHAAVNAVSTRELRKQSVLFT